MIVRIMEGRPPAASGDRRRVDENVISLAANQAKSDRMVRRPADVRAVVTTTEQEPDLARFNRDEVPLKVRITCQWVIDDYLDRPIGCSTQVRRFGLIGEVDDGDRGDAIVKSCGAFGEEIPTLPKDSG
jgi:hypothetical protein